MLRKKNAIYIAGCSFVNKGPEAMILTMAEAARKRFPGIDIFVSTPSLYFKQARLNGLIPLKGDQPTSTAAKLFSKIRSARTYSKIMAFVDLGGYQFGDPWGNEHAWKRLHSIKNCTRFGNQIFFLPQTWGPFSSASLCEAVRGIIQVASLVYARDKTSLRLVESLIDGKDPKVKFAHDVAWNFKGADLSVGQQLLKETGLPIDDNSLKVCVTPNLRVYERSEGEGLENKYIKTLRDVIHHLCTNHGAQVVLMGHELRLNNSEIQDDRVLCKYLISLVDKSLPVVHVDKYLPAAEVKSIIGNNDLLISSRYHGLIAGLSQAIPSIAVGWAHKYDELMAELDLSSNLISLSKTNKEILEDIDSVIKCLPKIRKVLPARVDEIKKSGKEAIDAVLSQIEERVRT